MTERSPLEDREYKHREDLLDAALCAWTAALWHRHGLAACQVLGSEPAVVRPAATIIAPARSTQRSVTNGSWAGRGPAAPPTPLPSPAGALARFNRIIT
nr:hypothetical protein ICEMyc226_00216 [Mycolicibacterium sp.]